MPLRTLLPLLVLLTIPTAHFSQANEVDVLLIGRVLRISPGPVVNKSGDFPSYRLVKYKIVKVLKGEYRPREITVDHLVLNGRELEGMRIGDIYKVAVRKVAPEKFLPYSPGIREHSETIKFVFLAEEVSKQNATRPKFNR